MLSRSLVLLLTLIQFSLPVVAQDKEDKDEPRPNLPVQQWLSGPDRQDFKWRLELSGPRLTYQQRNLVQVRAFVDAAPLAGNQPHELYFLLKIADAKGNWLRDDTYNHYPLPPNIDKKNEIQYSVGLYVKPGSYTAALMLYDSSTGKGNLWRKQFDVKPPKDDPLPQLDRNLPVVEFISEVPGDALPVEEHHVIPFHIRRPMSADVVDPEWPLGHGREFLPVASTRRLRVDIVLNLAPYIDPSYVRGTSPAQIRAAVGAIVQIGSVLSHIDLPSGCLQVGGIDLAKLKVSFPPVEGNTAEWDKIADQGRRTDNNTVSVDVLTNKRSTPGFLRDQIAKLAADSSGCPGVDSPDRVLILVSHDFQFPTGTHGDRVLTDFYCACRLIHLRVGSGGLDDLDRFLKPANAQRIDVHTPEQFRKALADLISQLSMARQAAR